MKAVNVDEVLKILHRYGKYIFVTDEKRYSDMVDEIANLKALEQEPILDKIRAEIAKRTIEQGFHADEWSISYDELMKIIDKYKAESER